MNFHSVIVINWWAWAPNTGQCGLISTSFGLTHILTIRLSRGLATFKIQESFLKNAFFQVKAFFKCNIRVNCLKCILLLVYFIKFVNKA